MLFLHLLLSVLVVFQPGNVVVVVELQEELYERVVYQLSCASSFEGVFLETIELNSQIDSEKASRC